MRQGGGVLCSRLVLEGRRCYGVDDMYSRERLLVAPSGTKTRPSSYNSRLHRTADIRGRGRRRVRERPESRLTDHRSPMERDGIPGLGVGGPKLKALNRLFRKMIQLIIARTSP
jgi:hypothetical protein